MATTTLPTAIVSDNLELLKKRMATPSLVAKSRIIELRSRVDWMLNRISAEIVSRQSSDKASLLGGRIAAFIENLNLDPGLKEQSWMIVELDAVADGENEPIMTSAEISDLHEILNGDHKHEKVVEHAAFPDHRCTFQFRRSSATAGAVQLMLTIRHEPQSQQVCCTVM
jgi:hypothetical protein